MRIQLFKRVPTVGPERSHSLWRAHLFIQTVCMGLLPWTELDLEQRACGLAVLLTHCVTLRKPGDLSEPLYFACEFVRMVHFKAAVSLEILWLYYWSDWKMAWGTCLEPVILKLASMSAGHVFRVFIYLRRLEWERGCRWYEVVGLRLRQVTEQHSHYSQSRWDTSVWFSMPKCLVCAKKLNSMLVLNMSLLCVSSRWNTHHPKALCPATRSMRGRQHFCRGSTKRKWSSLGKYCLILKIWGKSLRFLEHIRW